MVCTVKFLYKGSILLKNTRYSSLVMAVRFKLAGRMFCLQSGVR